MIKVIFSKEGASISDFEVEQMAKQVIEQYLKDSEKDIVEVVVNTSSECYMNAFVLHTMEGLIPEDEIIFFYENTALIFDEWLGLIFPEGFNPFCPFSEINKRILDIGYDKMKKFRKMKNAVK